MGLVMAEITKTPNFRCVVLMLQLHRMLACLLVFSITFVWFCFDVLGSRYVAPVGLAWKSQVVRASLKLTELCLSLLPEC